jgi:arylformamidase
MKLYIDPLRFIDTAQPLDISLSLSDSSQNPTAWYVSAPRFEPVRANGFIGSVAEGGSVNFRDIYFNPHGHGTHTECCGHITEDFHAVNQKLNQFFFKAYVVSIEPKKVGDDSVIFSEHFNLPEEISVDALIIRTLPNTLSKKSKNYSSTNPAFLDISVMEVIKRYDINHLLIDLPSVDKEEDEGVLAFHHAFFQVPENPNHKTITEFVFVPDNVKDGLYILNLQVAPFENDASPSRPVLYAINEL